MGLSRGVRIFIFILLLIIVYLLNVIDYCQTMYAVESLGEQVEGNPVGSYIIKSGYAFTIKIVAFPLLMVVMAILTWMDDIAIYFDFLLLISFTAVVIHNFMMLASAGLLL